MASGRAIPRRYRALNLLEELDQPGEYYVDRAAGRLYFWPPAPLVYLHQVPFAPKLTPEPFGQ